MDPDTVIKLANKMYLSLCDWADVRPETETERILVYRLKSIEQILIDAGVEKCNRGFQLTPEMFQKLKNQAEQ